MLPRKLPCPACQRPLVLPEGFRGGSARCPGCNNRLQINLFSDGSVDAKVLPGPLVIIKPAPRPEAVAPTPAPLRKKPPFLTRTGAVFYCPHCDRLTRIDEPDFNAALRCRCGGWYAVIVPHDGSIPADCRHCDFKMLVDPSMAGREVPCPDCDGPVKVPPEAMMVTPVKRPRPVEREPEPEPYRPAITYGAPGPKLCSICRQRYVRNPTSMCWACRRRLGWR
jgi:uncharacterized protein YbaR (Trm112 family)